jgi:hypothetical protein
VEAGCPCVNSVVASFRGLNVLRAKINYN